MHLFLAGNERKRYTFFGESPFFAFGFHDFLSCDHRKIRDFGYPHILRQYVVVIDRSLQPIKLIGSQWKHCLWGKFLSLCLFEAFVLGGRMLMYARSWASAFVPGRADEKGNSDEAQGFFSLGVCRFYSCARIRRLFCCIFRFWGKSRFYFCFCWWCFKYLTPPCCPKETRTSALSSCAEKRRFVVYWCLFLPIRVFIQKRRQITPSSYAVNEVDFVFGFCFRPACLSIRDENACLLTTR